MSSELAVYNHILIPFKIEVPTIYESYPGESFNIMLMEDLGNQTIETEPKACYFLESVRQLARIRLLASQRIERYKGTDAFYQRHFVPQEQYLLDLDGLITKLAPQCPDWGMILRKVSKILDKLE